MNEEEKKLWAALAARLNVQNPEEMPEEWIATIAQKIARSRAAWSGKTRLRGIIALNPDRALQYVGYERQGHAQRDEEGRPLVHVIKGDFRLGSKEGPDEA